MLKICFFKRCRFDEFVNFMAHIAPAVLEADNLILKLGKTFTFPWQLRQADCASLFMAVADDTSADMTQEVGRAREQTKSQE